MKQWMGLHIDHATLNVAQFNSETGRPVKLTAADGVDIRSAIAFVPRQSGLRTAQPVFPVDTKFESSNQDAPIFRSLRRTLPLLDLDDEIGTVMLPVFAYLRGLVIGEDVELSVAMPAEYSAALRDALIQTAGIAGFSKASYVAESTAAVLSCVPQWITERRRQKDLEAGQYVWLIDLSTAGATLCLSFVQRNKDEVSIIHLAGDRILGDGITAERLRHSLYNLHSLAGSEFDPARAWAIVSGSGGATDAAAAALSGFNPRSLQASAHVAGTEVMASGAAMYAIASSGTASFRLGEVETRMLLGVCVDRDDDRSFQPFVSSGTSPPYAFERAYRFEPGGDFMEITLAAALPGGQLWAPVLTLVLGAEELSTAAEPVGILVRGELDKRRSGRLTVRDLQLGFIIKEEAFQLA